MKTIKYIFAILTILSIVSACKRDPCKDKNCLNGGVCIDGTCDCPDGYSGSSCETKDPCYGITCLNGGYCANGQCVCSQGYTGSNCGQQITPTKIQISKIITTKFPQYNGGSNWDSFDGPDIFIYIYEGSTLVHEQPTFDEDADATLDYTYTPSSYIDLTDVNAQYTIYLYDYDDGLGDDYMGGISFNPYNSTGGFPTTIYLDAGGDVTFELTISYVW